MILINLIKSIEHNKSTMKNDKNAVKKAIFAARKKALITISSVCIKITI